MGMVNLEQELHKRLKRLAIDAGTTLGELVHKGATYIADATEKSLKKAKAKDESGCPPTRMRS